MKLYQKIAAINQGSIFKDYSLDGELFNNKVIADNKDIGLTDRLTNYFYIRRGSGNIEVKVPEIKLTSRDVREVYTPKVLVLQFQEYKIDNMLQMVLRQFGEYQSSVKVETKKDVILKSELGEIKPFPREVIMISYVEREIVDYCNDLDLFCCGEDVTPTPTPIDCLDADYIVEYENGDPIESGTIPSGGSATIEVPLVLDLELTHLEDDTTNTYPILTSNAYGTITSVTSSLTSLVIKVDGVVVTTPFVLDATTSEITTEHDAALSNGVTKLGGQGA